MECGGWPVRNETTMPHKKRIKSNRKRLMLRAVQAFNSYIRQRDPACVTCGSREKPTAGHILSAWAESTRFDEMNTFRQCAGCNFAHEHHPERYINWFIGKYGIEKWDELCARHWKGKKHTIEELEEIIAKYGKDFS